MPIVSGPIETYAERHSSPASELIDALAAETRATQKYPQMLIGSVEGSLLRTLAKAIRAERILEIGTYTGYSALWMAEALPDGGTLITCDTDPVSTALARQYWARSPDGDKIELRLGDASDTVKTLEGPFDLVFLDADKRGYVDYWETCVPMVRSGGLLIADNVLWGGAVLAPESASDLALVEFNKHVTADPRVDNTLLSVRDGLMVALKR